MLKTEIVVPLVKCLTNSRKLKSWADYLKVVIYFLLSPFIINATTANLHRFIFCTFHINERKLLFLNTGYRQIIHFTE